MGIALITGASSGLGLEFARLFAKDGHSVILVARRLDRLQELARELATQYPAARAYPIAMDLGQPGAGDRLFREVEALGLSQIDFLVNNAGFATSGQFVRLPLAKELEQADLNMRTLLELTGRFLPGMIQKGRGRILNVGSTAGFQPGPYMSTYYATKAFVVSFSEGLQEELVGTGVTCTVLAPGATRTEFAGTAGMESSRLFQAGAANAQAVARAGYQGMLQGKTIVIPGLMNKFLVQLLRVTPRVLARKIAGYLNQSA